MKELYPKGYHPMVTNFRGCGLQECDVLAITSARLLVEYEIKISRSDFKADFKKEHKHRRLSERDAIYESSYSDRRWIRIPNRFYYVCETDLIKLDEIPEYAGLIYVDAETKSYKTIKRAPLLHKHKADCEFDKAIARVLTARMIYGCSYMNWQRKQYLSD